MFVGRYAAGFAAKRYDPKLPLWLLFIAVQLLDVAWAPFVLLAVAAAANLVPALSAARVDPMHALRSE